MMPDCDCKHDDPLDCQAEKEDVAIEDLLADDGEGCVCDCHDEAA